MTRKHLKKDILFLVGTIFLVLIVGALLFSYIENWSFLDALYFVTMTATTVGYGDYIPTTALSKILTILFSLSIIPFVLYTFSFVAKAQMEKIYRKIHRLEKQQKEQEEVLEEEQKQIEAQKKKINEELEVNEIQDQELEVVEGVVEDIVDETLKKQ